MAYIECYNTVVYPHQFRLAHDLSIESFGGENLDNHEPEHVQGFSEDELNITELSNMHISHKANMVMNTTENGAPMFNNMYNRALHTALENDLKQTETRGHNRTLESFMVKNHPFTSTDQDDVFMKDDIIGQYSNNSYEHTDIPPSPSRMINKKNKYNKQRRTRRRLPDIPVHATSSSGYHRALQSYEKISCSSSNEELQTRSSNSPEGAGCASPSGGAVGAAGAGLSLADELREADPGLTLHHVDSNDRIAVINIVYSGDGEEGEDESVNPAAATGNGGGNAGPSTAAGGTGEGSRVQAPQEDEQYKRLSWDTDRDRCSVSTAEGSPMTRSLITEGSPMTRSLLADSAKSPFDFCEDSQYIDDSPQVFKSKYEDSPYTRQEVEEMETSSHTETTSSTTTSSLPGTSTMMYPSGGAEPTHRGCHKFIPRHKDEIFIEIGDPIYVEHEADDLWCEGVNLRTGKRGIFPSAYATDLSFIAVQDEGGTHSMRFYLQFLGSIQVNYNRGTDVLQQAINKVAFHRRSTLSRLPPAQCLVEINEYGIRMTDAEEGKKKIDNWEKMSAKQRLIKALEVQKEESASRNHNHFFPLKNVSFCGFHPRNERYFAFITKHPVENKFACHVFLGEGSTKCVAEAVGVAFRRFYQQYMAFVHPTEDIYMED